MEYRTLGKTGMKVSILSYGASPLGGVFDPADPEEGIRAVHYAIDHGVNYFDVAPMYGVTLAEKRLGVALKGKRDKVFLATKCGRYDVDKFDFSYNKILTSIDESLQRLQSDYVDVYQLHDIEFMDKEQVLNEAVPAAIKVKEQGKARFFGITGLPVRYLAAIAREVEVDTVLSWAHYNLLEDEINDELVPMSKEKGFGLLNASPLLQRILSDSPIPEWHRSPQEVKDVQPQLLALCEEYGVNVGDVANRYALDHPDIATTIVGMSKFKNIERNIKVLDFKIPDGLLEKVMAICNPVKNRMWFEGRPENNIPKPDSESSV
ncbi:MAG: aldo/keto reductase [Planctomycetota bacterium]